MKVGLLYRDDTVEHSESYPLDSDGRDDISHYNLIKEAIEKAGYSTGTVRINSQNFESLKNNDCDLLFNLCDDGFRNKATLEPHIPAVLDIFNIPYTGANYLSLGTCLNKARTKKILEYHNVRTPKFQVFGSPDDKLKQGLSFPFFVKPSSEDASIGIRNESVVNNEEELKQQVKRVIENYKQPALVEEFIDGREIYVGIIGHKNPVVMPITEIDFKLPPGVPKICSYDAKWKEESDDYKLTEPKCPAELDPELEKELKKAALKAFKVMGCRDYARVDFRVDKEGKPYVLEVNPNPDISTDAGLARMAKAKGWDYGDLIVNIVESAKERIQKTKLDECK